MWRSQALKRAAHSARRFSTAPIVRQAAAGGQRSSGAGAGSKDSIVTKLVYALAGGAAVLPIAYKLSGETRGQEKSTLSPEDVRKPNYGGAKAVKQALEEIARIVGVDRISRDVADLQIHSETSWSSFRPKVCFLKLSFSAWFSFLGPLPPDPHHLLRS